FWVASLVQVVFTVALAASDGYDVARSGEVWRVVLTYATLLALFGLIQLLVRVPRWNLRINALVFALLVAVNFARYETAGSFDYGFAHANIRELFTPLGRHIVLANVKTWEIAVLFVFPLLFGAAIARWPSRPWPGSPSSRRLAIAGCVVVLLGVPAARISTHESLTGFAVSALRFHAEARAAAATIEGAPFPFVHESAPSARARALAGSDAPRPHVIVLFLESWSARYAGKLRPDGRPFTPVFDEQRKKGLSYDHFYGNSVQSSRGHFATLCSLVPMVRAKEFVDIPGTRLHCLPEVLKDAGYRTSFHSASDEPEFDFAQAWLSRAGFDDVRFAPDRNVTPDAALWGVGIQDDVFYTRFFAALDEQVAREPGVPQLAVLANASHHYPFDKGPSHVPDPGYPTKYGRNYVGSLMAADAWLATFYAELDRRPAFRDAIVVVVGDHSFPADEHGIHFNGLGSFEEAFHTSFMLRWPGHVPPELVTDRAASQIDLAPTVLDLLQLRARTHFTGTSLVAGEATAPPVPLVQPYDGVHLAAVRWPFKLVRHESAEQEHLYDLAQDPDEEHDRIHDASLAGEVSQLRRTFARIHASEAILRANRVWSERP
ncbi:MAG TPA: sulfatase-like hydrolase/transferase, partial [Labilithrix sp.]|nr:sulfatase-like hydrolase/transferase [Labilithrix sp.]